jgi:hypothetical protein
MTVVDHTIKSVDFEQFLKWKLLSTCSHTYKQLSIALILIDFLLIIALAAANEPLSSTKLCVGDG